MTERAAAPRYACGMDGSTSPILAIDRNTPECIELKNKLVAAFHIIARRKMDDGIAGHISCRVPGTLDQFWVNPLGLFFEEVTFDHLLVVDLAGNLLEGKLPYNRAAFAIHATLHAQRHDVIAIWTFVPDMKADGKHVEFLWLMRTAAYLRTPDCPAAWREKLEARYASLPTHPHDVMGQYLLGKVDAETLWKASTHKQNRPEATWVMGLKAETDGDFENAIHWYRATTAGGRQNSGEVQWSSDSLSGFRSARKSLALLSAEAKARAL